MLCEGVMLYLMLVVVFSALTKKWWAFLIIGYGMYMFKDNFWSKSIHKKHLINAVLQGNTQCILLGVNVNLVIIQMQLTHYLTFI